ncbi:six-cysteine ranthipeptide SCIFF, partial [Anaerostipes hadrus]|nr:six-cysteine ranthipeptide SCIFF [Anaerostipes hadrus]
QTSCQSACKTSCTVGNQTSEIRDRICQKEWTDIHIWTKLSI